MWNTNVLFGVGMSKNETCRLGSKNLDLLVFQIMNWSDDPTIGFEAKKGPQNVDEFQEAKEEILDLLDVEFLDEVEDHVKECVHN
jgi:hypothetical protein